MTKIGIKVSAHSFILLISFIFALSLTDQSTGQTRAQGSNSGLTDLFQQNRENPVEVPVSRAQVQLSFAPLVKAVAPSVVNVYAARRQTTQRSPFAGDPFFERFFGRGFGRQQQRNQSSLGSGVIVTRSGTVVTNHHVIKGADEVKISLADGREFACDIILKDEKSDLAVLQVKQNVDFPALEIGDSDAVEVGDLVLAIGNPFGVGQTVTSGIVSAVARSRKGINDFGFFLQTDAAINPGNSGGALVDMSGRLIGINTAIFTRSGGSNGIGFAVPSNMVKVIIQSAETGDTVQRPWIGAQFQAVTSDIAESLGLDRPRGALIVGVTPGSPADAVGMRAGDVILAINGYRLEHLDALGYRMTTVGIGNEAQFTLYSRGKSRDVKITLAPAPETVPRNQIDLPAASALGGATVANLSPAVAQEIGVDPHKQGVVVIRVIRGSPAAQNGLRPRDIVRGINGQAITSTPQLGEAAEQMGRRFEMVVERQNRELVFARNGGFFRQFTR